MNKSNETVVPIERDHITICKFAGAQDPVFLKIFGRLHAEIAAIGTKGAERAQQIRQALESVPAIPTVEQNVF